jgi:hypothetical protein
MTEHDSWGIGVVCFRIWHISKEILREREGGRERQEREREGERDRREEGE